MTGIVGHRGLLLQSAGATAGVPPDTLSNLTLWINAADSTSLLTADGGPTVSADGDAVALAKSEASIARCVYSASGRRPAYKAGVVNGKSILRYNGTADQSLLYGRSGDTLGSQLSLSDLFVASAKTAIFAGLIPNSDAAQAQVYNNDAIFSDNGTYSGMHVSDAGGANITVYAYNWDGNADSVNVSVARSTFCVISMRHDGSTLQIRLNGGAWASTASGPTTNLASALNFAYAGNGGRWLPLDLAHFVSYNFAHTDSDLLSVETWIASELGFSI